MMEAQQEQQKIIDETNQKLKDEEGKRNELQKILAEMEERLVVGGNVLEEKEREQAQAQRKLQLELEKEKEFQK